MGKSLHVYIVDDSAVQTEIAKALLEKAGHVVITNRSSADALRDIPSRRPDCVLMDIMMPEIDGYELCRRLRAMPDLAHTKLLMMSTKTYPFERRRAAELGANGYFTKPLHPASFAAQLERLVADTLTMTFWGVRGTLPISRKDSARYGGGTSCMSLDFPDGRLFVFDAGSGIKALSDALMAARRTRIDGKILISHPHWDHINALPFFAPFYVQGNQFEICGASHGDVGMRDLISAQMDGVYFPVTVREFAADVTYRDLGEGEFEVGGIPVKTMLLRHPGNCLGLPAPARRAGRSATSRTTSSTTPTASSTPMSTSSVWRTSFAALTPSSPTAATRTRPTRRKRAGGTPRSVRWPIWPAGPDPMISGWAS